MEENAAGQDQTLLLARMLFLLGGGHHANTPIALRSRGSDRRRSHDPERLDQSANKGNDHAKLGTDEMPRGLTLLAIRQNDGTETLGLKTSAGVLDVAKTNAIPELVKPRSRWKTC